jgi:hypothetical protein
MAVLTGRPWLVGHTVQNALSIVGIVVVVVVVMVGGTRSLPRLGDTLKLKSEWSQSLAAAITHHQCGGRVVVVVGGACGLRVLWGPSNHNSRVKRGPTFKAKRLCVHVHTCEV